MPPLLDCTPTPLQLCWLLILPCALVYLRELSARREFVLSLPPGALAAAERATWAGYMGAGVPLWQVLCLYLPALSMAIWRLAVLALARWFGE